MKAKNKYQRRVVEVDKKMKPIGKRILNWVKEDVLEHPAIRNKTGNITCLTCNHKFKTASLMAWHDEIGEIKCPNCKRHLHVRQSQKRTFFDSAFFSHVEKLEEYQVIRTSIMCVHYKTNKAPRYYDTEGFRIYIDKDGRRDVIGRLRQGGFYSWSGNFQGYLELRDPKVIDNKYSDEGALYPKWKLQDFSLKAGFNQYEYADNKFTVSKLLKIMFTIPNLETIKKTKDKDLLEYSYQEPDDIKKYWSTLKICWRNKYKIKSWRSYFDMIKALNAFGKDLRNRHYVCPRNFDIAHNFWTNELYKRYKRMADVCNIKAEERQRMANIEYQQRIERKKDDYNMRMLRFADLNFVFGDLKIVPLLTVESVEEAGELMGHCIYKTDGYWTNKDNLLLATYEKEKLIETTQYSLENKEIYHSYGRFNQESKHHKKLKNIILSNKDKIHECLIKKRKTMEKQSA